MRLRANYNFYKKGNVMNNPESFNNILAEERTLLAAERTFSAWIRTALAAMAGGLAVLRLIIFRSEFHRILVHIIGETLILWGCLLIVLSAIDYKNTRNKLVNAQSYKSSQLGFLVVVLPLLLISALLIWVTLP
jgi:putative membrane protein